jgi:signal transduction histidine kinase
MNTAWGIAEWTSSASAIVFLVLAVLAVVHAKRSALAAPLGRMSAALFAYEALEVLKHITGREEFFVLECAAAALVPQTTAALVIQFLGAWRSLRTFVAAFVAYYGLICFACIAALFVDALHDFPGSSTWALLLLAGLVPQFTYLFYRLRKHAKTSGAEERARTLLLSVALVLGVAGVSTDLTSIVGLEVPRLAAFGLIAGGLCLAALAFRFAFLEGVTALAIMNAAAIGFVALIAHLFLLTWVGTRTTLVALLSLAVTLAAVATLRPVLTALLEERERRRYLVTMGRFSAQMAHDLRNPLAAIHGAAQYLEGERQAGRSLDSQGDFVALILEQSERLDRVIGDYQRLGKAEARREQVDIAALFSDVATPQRAASAKHTIDLAIEEGIGSHPLDRDLLLAALENLVRNAREATPEGTRITLRASKLASKPGVLLSVEDEGPGMDARTRERAFDDFYTTKATGTGLGLAFVMRVAVAHGGRASLDGERMRGTKVTMELPDN